MVAGDVEAGAAAVAHELAVEDGVDDRVVVLQVRDEQRLPEAHGLYERLREVRRGEANLRVHLGEHPCARDAVRIQHERVATALVEDDGVLEAAALLRQRLGLPLHAQVRVRLGEHPLDDVERAAQRDAKAFEHGAPALMQRRAHCHIEAAGVGKEAGADERVAAERAHARVKRRPRLVPPRPLRVERSQQRRRARHTRRHLLHLRLEPGRRRDHLRVLRLEARDALLEGRDLAHHALALALELLLRLFERLNLLAQRFDAGEDAGVIDLALDPRKERAARLGRALRALRVEPFRRGDGLAHAPHLRRRDALGVVVHDGADEVAARHDLARVLPFLGALAEHGHDHFHRRAHDGRRPRERAHLVELRLLDGLHRRLRGAERRLHLGELLLDGPALLRDLLAARLELCLQPRGLGFALLRLVLLRDHLLQLLVSGGVLALELGGLLLHRGLQVRDGARRLLELVETLPDVHGLLLEARALLPCDARKAAQQLQVVPRRQVPTAAAGHLLGVLVHRHERRRERVPQRDGLAGLQ
mmetsp:Transcript_45197/g.141628  ORF Transcript_45197/g.141628 Transcript_45197/m.141628 type:complete len:532 (+) Transcript_45197:987-2582(+)